MHDFIILTWLADNSSFRSFVCLNLFKPFRTGLWKHWAKKLIFCHMSVLGLLWVFQDYYECFRSVLESLLRIQNNFSIICQNLVLLGLRHMTGLACGGRIQTDRFFISFENIHLNPNYIHQKVLKITKQCLGVCFSNFSSTQYLASKKWKLLIY